MTGLLRRAAFRLGCVHRLRGTGLGARLVLYGTGPTPAPATPQPAGPVPPRNLTVRIHGDAVPVAGLRYDGLLPSPKTGDRLHAWVAVLDCPAPLPGAPIELTADVPPATSIYLQFILDT